MKATQTKSKGAMVKGVVQFEPCMVLATKKKGLSAADEKPVFTLRKRITLQKDTDAERTIEGVYVFGMQDCLDHGDGSVPSRLNHVGRYGTDDYLDMFQVLMLHLFNKERGNREYIAPNIVLSIPISVYNDEDGETVKKLRARLQGKYEIRDIDGCELKLKVEEKKLTILPESVGVIEYYARDHISLMARPGSDPKGNILVVDGGYLTGNFSLFIDMAYQRKRGMTEKQGGMKVVVDAIKVYLDGKYGIDSDVSQIDAGLRTLTDLTPGVAKTIYLDGKFAAEISEPYDQKIPQLTNSYRNMILNNYGNAALSAVLFGGGLAHHIYEPLSKILPTSVPLIKCPDADLGNVLGAFARVRTAAKKNGAIDPLIASGDIGNGMVSGISTDTMPQR